MKDATAKFLQTIQDRSVEDLLQNTREGWRYAAELEQKRKELMEVLKDVLNLLGPDAPECCGCRYEWQQAVDLIKKRLEGR